MAENRLLYSQIFRSIGVPAVKLLLIPGLVEAFFNGGLAVALFGMSPLFGFALGFILKAIGPALVIQLMFQLQQRRIGTASSAPPCIPCMPALLTNQGCRRISLDYIRWKLLATPVQSVIIGMACASCPPHSDARAAQPYTNAVSSGSEARGDVSLPVAGAGRPSSLRERS